MNKADNKKIDASKKQQIDMAMHCDEVQEVMGEIPSWIVRWGITVIFAIVVTLIVGSHFFYYPDVVKTDIRITTTEADNAALKSIGEIKIPATGSGKIMPGQQVNVFIANYPYSEYGYVTGVIDRIDEEILFVFVLICFCFSLVLFVSFCISILLQMLYKCIRIE